MRNFKHKKLHVLTICASIFFIFLIVIFTSKNFKANTISKSPITFYELEIGDIYNDIPFDCVCVIDTFTEGEQNLSPTYKDDGNYPIYSRAEVESEPDSYSEAKFITNKLFTYLATIKFTPINPPNTPSTDNSIELRLLSSDTLIRIYILPDNILLIDGMHPTKELSPNYYKLGDSFDLNEIYNIFSKYKNKYKK